MQDFTNIIVAPTDSIRYTMRILDSEALRIALICDKQTSLLGTVTDGDIRRALLRDANMDDPISCVMNTKPHTASISTTRTQRLKLMQEYELTAIPIINEERRVIGVETLHQAMLPEKKENPVFIMAGGFGTRLQPLTDHCPKPMLRVGEKPMLEHLINQFIFHGFCNFYISTHYLPEVIKRYFGDGSQWNVKINYVHEEQPLGTGGALGLLPKNLPDLPIIMMNGDVLTKLNYSHLLQHHMSQKFDATMCVREDEHYVPFGVIETKNQLITNMVEKPTYNYKINTGIYVLDPCIIANIQTRQKIDMPTLLDQSLKQGKRIGTYTSYDYWLDIGQMKDYQKAQLDIKTYFKES